MHSVMFDKLTATQTWIFDDDYVSTSSENISVQCTSLHSPWTLHQDKFLTVIHTPLHVIPRTMNKNNDKLVSFTILPHFEVEK